jgi:HTH-type transcriptional regulator/antitoxin HigA
MLDKTLLQAEQAWPSVAKVLYVPRDNAEYERLVNVLDHLIDEVGEDETHPLASLMEVIGILIAQYEDEHVLEFDESQGL